MTREEWNQNYKVVLADADKYNKWANKTQTALLKNIGPRLAKLKHAFYMGCGVHYSLEQDFGRLIIALSTPWRPSGNWLNKINDDYAKSIMNQVILISLMECIVKAEKDIRRRNAT